MTYVGNSCGAKMLAASIFRDAIMNGDESFLNDDEFGYLINYCMQKATCNSYSSLKKMIKDSYELKREYNKLNLSDITEDAKTMTISQLAFKYDRPSQSIRNYLVRHNIPYVKVKSEELRNRRWLDAEKELSNIAYKYTITELLHLKGYSFSGCNYNTLKKFCDEKNIPYKRVN